MIILHFRSTNIQIHNFVHCSLLNILADVWNTIRFVHLLLEVYYGHRIILLIHFRNALWFWKGGKFWKGLWWSCDGPGREMIWTLFCFSRQQRLGSCTLTFPARLALAVTTGCTSPQQHLSGACGHGVDSEGVCPLTVFPSMWVGCPETLCNQR